MILVFLTSHAFSQDIQNIVISKTDDLNKLKSISALPVELTLDHLNLSSDNLKQISECDKLDRVEGLNLFNLKQASRTNLEKLFSFFTSSAIKRLHISEISQPYEFNINENFGDKLEELRITGCRLNSSVFMKFFTTGNERMKILDLSNTNLDEKTFQFLKNWPGFRNVEYLDLSGSSEGNRLLTLFPSDDPGMIKILKMNECGFTISENKKYSADFPALSYIIGKTLPAINWSSPYFRNLERLEIDAEADEEDDPSLLHEDTVLCNLKHFLGFRSFKYLLLFNYDNEDISERKKRSVAYNQFKKMVGKPIKSVINNYEFYSMSMLNQFAQTPRSQYTENLIFRYRSWDVESVEAVLSSGVFKSLKRIQLLQLNASQKDLHSLTMRYPQYDFEIEIFNEYDGNGVYIKREPYFWPRIEVSQ